MNDAEFDRALVGSFFRLLAENGWARTNIAEAARSAGLPLAEARARFPNRAAVLLRFGRMADQAALAEVPANGSVRDNLFDLLMRRFDAHQAHRDGVLRLIRTLPFEPSLGLLLMGATRHSMRWMLQAAGSSTAGLRGEARLRGLIGVWLWTLRAWERDETTDLSATMAALDAALNRAERMATLLGGSFPGAPTTSADETGDAGEEPGSAPESPIP